MTAAEYLPGDVGWLVLSERVLVFLRGEVGDALRLWPLVNEGRDAEAVLGELVRDGGPERWGLFILAAVEDGGLRVCARGAAAMVELDDGPPDRVDGMALIGWAEQVVPTARRLVIGPPDGQWLPTPGGVLRAGGVRWSPAKRSTSPLPEIDPDLGSNSEAPADESAQPAPAEPVVADYDTESSGDSVLQVGSAVDSGSRTESSGDSRSEEADGGPGVADHGVGNGDRGTEDRALEDRAPEDRDVEDRELEDPNVDPGAEEPTAGASTAAERPADDRPVVDAPVVDPPGEYAGTEPSDADGVDPEGVDAEAPEELVPDADLAGHDAPDEPIGPAGIAGVPVLGPLPDLPELPPVTLPPFVPAAVTLPPVSVPTVSAAARVAPDPTPDSAPVVEAPSAGSQRSEARRSEPQVAAPPAEPPGAESPVIAAVPAVASTAPDEDTDDLVGDHDGRTQLAEDLPEDYVPAPLPPAPPAGTVLAVLCPAGHPNAPRSQTCRLCGQVIPEADPVPVTRPVLARLRVSTGELVDVDRPVIIGRAPFVSRVAAADLPRLVSVPSPHQDISRAHAQVRTEDWSVVVADLDSTNGTTVLPPGRQPIRLRPGQDVVVEPGWIVDIGDGVSFVVEALV